MYLPRYYPGKFILPVIVTPGARIEPLPDPRPYPQPKISIDTKLLLLMAAAVLAIPETWISPRRVNTRRRPPDLSGIDNNPPAGLGTIQHCYDWKPVMSKFGYPVWRCAAYGSSCKDGEAVGPGPSGGAVRACVEYKDVYSPRYDKEIRRCVKYARVIDESCVAIPFPAERSFTEASKTYIKPTKRRSKRKGERVVSAYERSVQSIAKGMAKMEREAENAESKTLYHEIKSRGGIRSYRKGQLREEYSLIPLHLKNKQGLPLDEMASEMGMDETELLRQIRDTYPRKKSQKIDWKDYEEDGREIMEADIEPIMFPLLMQESLGAIAFNKDRRPGGIVGTAVSMKKNQFSKWYLKNEKAKIKGERSDFAKSLRSGELDAAIIEEGKQLHEKIVREAVFNREPVGPEAKAEYKNLRERPTQKGSYRERALIDLTLKEYKDILPDINGREKEGHRELLLLALYDHQFPSERVFADHPDILLNLRAGAYPWAIADAEKRRKKANQKNLPLIKQYIVPFEAQEYQEEKEAWAQKMGVPVPYQPIATKHKRIPEQIYFTEFPRSPKQMPLLGAIDPGVIYAAAKIAQVLGIMGANEQ